MINNLIGVSGKIRNGKDEVSKIINYIYSSKNPTFNQYQSDSVTEFNYYKIKKFADKLKDIVCILIGCTRTQLENHDFKDKELSEEWWYWLDYSTPTGFTMKPYNGEKITHLKDYGKLIKLTPRKLLQLLGSNLGREIIHPNLWVNALFSEYKPLPKQKWFESHNILNGYAGKCNVCGDTWYSPNKRNKFCEKHNKSQPDIYPNWIISDVRYPNNEGYIIKKNGGYLIGVKRFFGLRFPKYKELELPNDRYATPPKLKECNLELYESLNFESEVVMGDFIWCDVVIENNGTLEELYNKILKIIK